jgi:hypothetical protein
MVRAVKAGAMFLVINAYGQFWDGLGWNQQGKPFLSVSAATRSLCEEGEDIDEVNILETRNDPA